jgi:hypothetical protein
MFPTIYQTLQKLISNSGDKLELLNSLPPAFLAQWHIYDFAYSPITNGRNIYALIAIEKAIVLPLPGLENIILIIGNEGTSSEKIELFDVKITALADSYNLKIANIKATLIFDVPFLKPVDETINTVALSAEISFSIDSINGIDIDAENGLSLLPCYIGESGLIVNAQDIVFTKVNDKPVVKVENAEIIFPDVFNIPAGIKISFDDAQIAASGFTGKCSADIPMAPGATLFGLPGGINHVDIDIDANIPKAFRLKASLILPFFSDAIDVKLNIEQKFNVLLEVNAVQQTIDVGPGTLTFSGGILKGNIKENDLLVEGEVHNVLIDMPGLQINGNLLKTKLSKNDVTSLLSIDIENFKLGALGTLSKGSLKIEENKKEETFEVNIDTVASWADFKDRMQLADVFASSSVQDNDVLINCQWLKNDDGSTWAKLLFSLNVNDISGLWSFIPPAFQPSVKNLSLKLKATYEDAEDFANADEDDTIAIEGSVHFDFKLPEALQLPPNDLIVINTGNADGYIGASLSVTVDNDEQKIDISIENPVTVAINLPGLKQDVAPLQLSLDKVLFNTSIDDDGTEGIIEIEGTFKFLPLDLPVSVPFSNTLEQFLGDFTSTGIAGKAKLKLVFKDGKSACDIICTFDNTSLEVDLFDMIAGLTRGMVPPADVKSNDEQTIDIDIPFSFGLKGFSLHLGSISDDKNAEEFKFSVDFGFNIMEIEAVVGMELSDKACTIGFKTFEVPLRFPKFPLKAADLLDLNTTAKWNDKISFLQTDIKKAENLEKDFESLIQNFINNKDSKAIIKTIDSKLKNLAVYLSEFDKAKINDAFNFIKSNATLLPASDGLMLSTKDVEPNINDVLKRTKRSANDLKIKKALLVSALSIRSKITDEGSRKNYEGLLREVTLILNAITGVMHVDTDAKLVITDAVLKIPFSDPRGISIEGSAAITGFADDDKLKCLEGIELGLGLSSDRIYFFAKSLGTPIPVLIGDYMAGSVSFTEFSIGYGFTKNSFSIAFSGKAEVSERLQSDTDTSSKIGLGIRLPRNIAIAFRLDLIPVPGPIPVVPFLEFDINLQSPQLAAISNVKTCTPNWDGLQFIMPDIIRFGFKRAAFSPVLGILPIPNYSYAYDFSIGNKQDGLSVICDNFLVPIGIGSIPQLIPIPFFIDPSSPYFDNLCMHINIAGFEINYHIQRPLPQLNPLAVFEMLGLLSDPLMPVDSKGPLANTVKVAITDTSINCPDYITYLVPALKELNKTEVNIVLNLGTAITAFQQIMQLLKKLMATLEKLDKTVQEKMDEAKKLLNKPNLDKVIALIPPELRRLSVEADLGGFMASMTIVITDANDTDALKEAFKNKRKKREPVANNFKIKQLKSSATSIEISNYKVPLKLENGQSVYDPNVDSNRLFDVIEFESFTDKDLSSFPIPPTSMPGVIAAAYVQIMSQRFRFLGCLYQDGSFGMITTLDIEPLLLSVAGIAVKMNLACKGRIMLKGIRNMNLKQAVATAQGYADWNAIPGIVQIKIGNANNPVRVQVENNGKFNIDGTANILLFNGAALLNGSLDISDTHCFVTGNFTFNPQITVNTKNLIDFTIEGLSRIGPGKNFEMGGVAQLNILGQTVTQVKAVVTNNKINLEYLYAPTLFNSIGKTFALSNMNIKMKGELNYDNISNAGFNFEGRGAFGIINPGTVDQLFGVDGQVVLGYTLRNGISLKCLGKVDWFGMNWIGGGVELNNQSIKIFGSTKITMPITTADVPALNIDLAHLVFNIDLTGEVILKSDFSFSVKVKGSWMLGVSAAAGDKNCFPIASQKIDINDSNVTSVILINFRGLDFLPASDLLNFTVTVPGNSRSKLDLYKGDIAGTSIFSPVKLFDWPLVQVPLPDFVNKKDVNINLISLIKEIGRINVALMCDQWRPYLQVSHIRNTQRINTQRINI